MEAFEKELTTLINRHSIENVVDAGLARVRFGLPSDAQRSKLERLVGRSVTKGGQVQTIGILISPSGEEWFDAYGPMTKDRKAATVFTSHVAAQRAAMNRFGRGGAAFWECEREQEHRDYKRYAGWTNRAEEIPFNAGHDRTSEAQHNEKG